MQCTQGEAVTREKITPLLRRNSTLRKLSLLTGVRRQSGDQRGAIVAALTELDEREHTQLSKVILLLQLLELSTDTFFPFKQCSTDSCSIVQSSEHTTATVLTGILLQCVAVMPFICCWYSMAAV
jgi:hypothetical protein